MPLAAETVTITILATTDVHGHIMPHDYFTAKPAERGLAGLAAHIAAVRKENPNTLLVDCGDTIQGSPLEAVFQHYRRTGKLPLNLAFPGEPFRADPMMLVMNHLRYDAMVLGNHEFNFGLKNLNAARAEAAFPWLSANTVASDGARPFEPYIVKSLSGVKVAVLGITTPAIPLWEKPENYAGYRFEDAVQSAARTVAELKAKHKPDLIVAAVHSGLGKDIKTGRPFPGETPGENVAYDVAASAPGIDALVYGHSHRQLEGALVKGVLLVQPRNFGMSLARMDFRLEGAPGRWKLIDKRSRLIPATQAADPEIARIAQPYHEMTERYLDSPVAVSPVEMDGALGRVQDSPLVDLIHRVQLHYSGADVSFTSLFNHRVKIPKGRVTVRQIAALYLYDNELYAIEGNGRMVREALENAARYFTGCADPACNQGPGINRSVPSFNFDMAQGVEYEIDLTKPEGRRVVNLRWRGKPLADDQPLRIAVNNYRAAGSGGYSMFRDAKIVWRASQEIRDLIIEYYSERGELPASADRNWRIIPDKAREQLMREAQAAPGARDDSNR
jgi:2',3'-cyclic-nucleotide 2'-phosphodiesterase/3'-nucleotidase